MGVSERRTSIASRAARAVSGAPAASRQQRTKPVSNTEFRPPAIRPLLLQFHGKSRSQGAAQHSYINPPER